jgi:hypothetical protein
MVGVDPQLSQSMIDTVRCAIMGRFVFCSGSTFDQDDGVAIGMEDSAFTTIRCIVDPERPPLFTAEEQFALLEKAKGPHCSKSVLFSARSFGYGS